MHDAEQPRNDPASRLVELETWLALALTASRIGTWDWDLVTDRVQYNTFEGAIRETTGAAWTGNVHPDDLDRSSQAVALAVSGVTDRLEYTTRMSLPRYDNGRWSYMRSRGQVIARDADGRATRMVGIYEDVTEAVHRKEHEQEREAALAHALRLTSLSALSSSFAHEINQPLAALTSYLETALNILQQPAPPPRALEMPLQRSLELAERISEIVRRLRRLLRREDPLLERVEIGSLLQGVRKALERDAAAAGIKLSVSDECAMEPLWGDHVQIEQALLNLGRNAIEAAASVERPDRRVVLAASLEAESVVLSVTDTGPGVPEVLRPRLFMPFFTTKHEGTGLGLMICESVAEIHGGQLRATFDQPKGTRFSITLPRHPAGVPSTPAVED